MTAGQVSAVYTWACGACDRTLSHEGMPPFLATVGMTPSIGPYTFFPPARWTIITLGGAGGGVSSVHAFCPVCSSARPPQDLIEETRKRIADHITSKL
jgi:hypothetical protein